MSTAAEGPPQVNRLEMSLEQYEKLNPVTLVEHEGVEIIYCTPTLTTKWRADGAYANEPRTLEWIAGFAAEDVVFDVGANVGMYTMWAALTRGARVYAFEPESQNYAVLCKNILYNGAQDRVTAYCMAISNETKISHLNLNGFSAGASMHAFDARVHTSERPDAGLDSFEPVLRQGSMSMSIDALVAHGLPVPTHIKADVDGFEDKVIDGARETLARRRTASLLIEINPRIDAHRRTVRRLEGLGYAAEDTGEGNVIFRRPSIEA